MADGAGSLVECGAASTREKGEEETRMKILGGKDGQGWAGTTGARGEHQRRQMEGWKSAG